MRPFAAASLLVLSLSTVTAILPSSTTFAFAAQEEIVTETISLNFIKPSVILKIVQTDPTTEQNPSAFLLVIKGITSTMPDDTAKTLKLTGTKASIEEMRNMVRLLDVRPRQLILKTRLVETRIDSSGRRVKNVLQTSLLKAFNNQTVQTALTNMEGADGSESGILSTSLGVHINGDSSVSFYAKLERQSESGDRKTNAGASTYQRFDRPNEWNTFRTVGFSSDKEIQRKMLDGSVLPPSAYPLYSLEVLYTEVKE